MAQQSLHDVGWAEKRTEKVDPLFRKRDVHHFLRGTIRVRPGTTGREQPKPYDGVTGPLRLSGELKMVHENIHHPVSQQSGPFPDEAVGPPTKAEMDHAISGEVQSLDRARRNQANYAHAGSGWDFDVSYGAID
jgi:hypothetical protein